MKRVSKKQVWEVFTMGNKTVEGIAIIEDTAVRFGWGDDTGLWATQEIETETIEELIDIADELFLSVK